MEVVIVISPRNDHAVYAIESLRNALCRGEVPWPRVIIDDLILNVDRPTESEVSELLVREMLQHCDRLAVYIDKGIDESMQRVIAMAYEIGASVVFRTELKPELDMHGLSVVKQAELSLRVITGGKT